MLVLVAIGALVLQPALMVGAYLIWGRERKVVEYDPRPFAYRDRGKVA